MKSGKSMNSILEPALVETHDHRGQEQSEEKSP